MAILIHVDPDALRAAARKQAALSDSLTAAVQKMNELRTRLNKAWDGGASMAAINGLRELANLSKALVGDCDESVRYLNFYADAFEALDNGKPIPANLSAIRLDGVAGLGRMAGPISLIHVLTPELRIIPEEVVLVSTQLVELSAKLQRYGRETGQMVDQLQSSWQGGAYNTFAREANGLVRSFQSVSERLKDLGSQIRTAAERYEELDALLAQ